MFRRLSILSSSLPLLQQFRHINPQLPERGLSFSLFSPRFILSTLVPYFEWKWRIAKTTNQELLTSIKALPVDQQYALANSILEDLIQKGRLPISDAIFVEIDRRVAAFDADPNAGESWENVRQELFGE